MISCIKFEIVSALLMSVSSFVVCQISFDYSTGGVCNTDSNFACQKLSNCSSALEDIKTGGRPKICSFHGKEPIVCCDLRRSTGLQLNKVDSTTIFINLSNNNGHWQTSFGRKNTTDNTFGKLLSNLFTMTEGSSEPRNNQSSAQLTAKTTMPPPLPAVNENIAELWCLAYMAIFCNDIPSNYVAYGGGVPAKPSQLPHMALIGYGPENDKSWLCGGSVISRRYILSAAHCTYAGTNKGYAKWVRLGDLDHSTTTDFSNHRDYTIIERNNHPRYNPPLSYNDIALYKVHKEIYFDKFVKPVCLHTDFHIFAREGIAAGWGRTEFVGPTSNILMYGNLSFVNPEKCNDNLQNKLSKSSFPDGIIHSIVCAGQADGSQDTCQGDSGGPLFIRNITYGCPFEQIGVISTGLPCGQEDTPGIYTRVSSYIPWIESIAWVNEQVKVKY